MSRSRRDGVFRTIVERRKIFGRLVAQIIATDSPPRVIVSQVPLARALYESRSALLELVGVRLCLSFAIVFVLGSWGQVEAFLPYLSHCSFVSLSG